MNHKISGSNDPNKKIFDKAKKLKKALSEKVNVFTESLTKVWLNKKEKTFKSLIGHFILFGIFCALFFYLPDFAEINFKLFKIVCRWLSLLMGACGLLMLIVCFIRELKCDKCKEPCLSLRILSCIIWVLFSPITLFFQILKKITNISVMEKNNNFIIILIIFIVDLILILITLLYFKCFLSLLNYLFNFFNISFILNDMHLWTVQSLVIFLLLIGANRKLPYWLVKEKTENSEKTRKDIAKGFYVLTFFFALIIAFMVNVFNIDEVNSVRNLYLTGFNRAFMIFIALDLLLEKRKAKCENVSEDKLHDSKNSILGE